MGHGPNDKLISGILRLHFNTVRKGGDTSAIFVYVCTDIMPTVDQEDFLFFYLMILNYSDDLFKRKDCSCDPDADPVHPC